MRSEEFAILDNGIFNTSRPMSPIDPSTRDHTRNDVDTSAYALPSEARTRELLKCYFSNTGLLFPYIHEPSFVARYDELKENNYTRVSRTWLGLLNMVLAMSTNTIVNDERSVGQRMAESDIFYRRALELCSRQILRGTSLEIGTAKLPDLSMPHNLLTNQSNIFC